MKNILHKYVGFAVLTLLLFSIYLLSTFTSTQAQSETPSTSVWRGHENGVSDLSFAPDGYSIVSSGLDGTIRLWNVKSGKVQRIIRSEADEIYALTFSADGKYVASTGSDRRILISKANNGEAIRVLTGFEGWSQAVAFSPDSRQIAASGHDGNVRIWEVESGKLIRTLESKQWQTALAWSPDGKYIVGGSSALTLWNAATGEQIKKFVGHGNPVRCINFSHDGKLLASASLDKTARIWNVESGALLRTIEPTGLIQFTPSGKTYNNEYKLPVLAVAFSPDDKQLATGGMDRLVQLWDVASGSHLQSLLGHTMTITGVKFSPDGKYIASSSLDRTIRVWKLNV